MILVDSNVIIDALHKKIPNFMQVLFSNDLAICGAIKSEVLSGSNSEEETEKLENTLKVFSFIDFSNEDWKSLGLFIGKLRKHGLKVPFPDAMISYLAIKTDCEVWTNDKHFGYINQVCPELKLYKN